MVMVMKAVWQVAGAKCVEVHLAPSTCIHTVHIRVPIRIKHRIHIHMHLHIDFHGICIHLRAGVWVRIHTCITLHPNPLHAQVTISSPSGTVERVPEVVQALYPRPNRTMEGLVMMNYTLKLVEINLFAVVSVVPEFAEGEGGTVVTIHGEGISLHNATRCRFGDEAPSRAEFVRTNGTAITIVCVMSAPSHHFFFVAS